MTTTTTTTCGGRPWPTAVYGLLTFAGAGLWWGGAVAGAVSGASVGLWVPRGLRLGLGAWFVCWALTLPAMRHLAGDRGEAYEASALAVADRGTDLVNVSWWSLTHGLRTLASVSRWVWSRPGGATAGAGSLQDYMTDTVEPTRS